MVVPYAHSQNGVVKCLIRTVFNRVRCLLAESGLPKSLWAEAAATIIYMRNLLPSACHPEVIPEEKWLGKRQWDIDIHLAVLTMPESSRN